MGVWCLVWEGVRPSHDRDANIETRRKSKTIANLSPETDRDWDRDFVHATARFRLKVRTYI